jgi:nucleotide-binding universal stress UspA family protein
MQMRVVVGVGDNEFKAPLQWAIESFCASGAIVEVIHCIAARLSTEMPYSNDGEVARGQLRVDEALAFARACGASVIARVLEGYAGEVLVENSIDANLLVVGASRTRHVLHAPKFSVVTYCIRHTCCPLTIVPTVVNVDAEMKHLRRP